MFRNLMKRLRRPKQTKPKLYYEGAHEGSELPRSSLSDVLIALEPRYMFDAAGAATGVEVAADTVAQQQAEHAINQADHPADHVADHAVDSGHVEPIPAAVDSAENLAASLADLGSPPDKTEIVFVDRNVANYETLIQGINGNAELVFLDSNRDGVDQIAETLSGRENIDAIHIISHGDAGQLQLGNTVLNQESMQEDYADDLEVIKSALSDSADILIYGCNFAEGHVGSAAADTLADLTGADIAASDDVTGVAERGGDLVLESTVGHIETDLILTDEAVARWGGTLALAVSDGNAVTDTDMANEISGAGSGLNISNPSRTYVGEFGATNTSDNAALGTFTGLQDSNGQLLNSGIVISTGNITALPADGTAGNSANNNLAAASNDDDADLLNYAVANGIDFEQNDITAYRFDFTSDVRKLAVEYVFGTDETAFYANQNYNDLFGIFLTDKTTSVTSTVAAHNIANEFNTGGFNANIDTGNNVETNSNTGVLSSVIDLNNFSGNGPGSDYSIKFSIADQRDSGYDSAAFIGYFGSSLRIDADSDDSSGAGGKYDYNNSFGVGGSDVAVVDSDIAITNFDSSATINTATITITNAVAGDSLIDTGVGANFSVTGDGSSNLTLTWVGAGTATEADFQTALQQIHFDSTSSNTVDRSISIVLNDTETDSNTATTTINVIDLPTVDSQLTTPQPIVTGTYDSANANSLAVSIDGITYTLGVDPALTTVGDNWSLDLNVSGQTLANGIYDVSVTSGDGVATTTDASSNEITVDAIAPAAPTVSTLTTSDSTPVITGTYDSTDAGGGFQVTVDGTTYTLGADPELTAVGNNWSLDLSATTPLADGPYDVVAQATDTAGNPATDITASELIVDTTGPAVTVNTLTTSNTQPTISGTFDSADATATGLTVTIDGTTYTLGTDAALSTAGNNWSLDLSVSGQTLVLGTYNVTTTTTDALGNAGSDVTSNEVQITVVDVTPPAAPTVNAQTTADTTPIITGTFDEAEYIAGGTFTVTITGPGPTNQTYTLGTDPELTNTGGAWTLDLTSLGALANGTYDVSAELTDAAGNGPVADSTSNELVIDTTQNVDGIDDTNSVAEDAPATGTGNVLTNDTNSTGTVTGSALSEFIAANDATSNDLWEDQAGGGIDWDFGTGVLAKNTAPSTNYPGITESYSFPSNLGGGATATDYAEAITENSASFEFWVKVDPSATSGSYLIFETGDARGGMAVVYNATSGQMELHFDDDDNGQTYQVNASLGSIDPTADFIQIVAVVDDPGESLQLYVNGGNGNGVGVTSTFNEATFGDDIDDWSNNDGMGLGTAGGGGGGGNIVASASGASDFIGEMAIVRTYQSALSANSIESNYAAVADHLYVSGASGTTSGTMPEGSAGSPNQITITADNGGQVTISSDGTYTYDPNGITPGLFNYLKAGETATDTFTYTVTDIFGNTDTATVTITINGADDVPVMTPDTGSVTEDVGVSGGNLTATGTLAAGTGGDAGEDQFTAATGLTGTGGYGILNIDIPKKKGIKSKQKQIEVK